MRCERLGRQKTIQITELLSEMLGTFRGGFAQISKESYGNAQSHCSVPGKGFELAAPEDAANFTPLAR